ncbi:MAG: PQQ-dependent sugar dehydrogenase [Gammaproteobacteria bacterium]|nr:PQQ-dependent sugar dehydrogenase [Gammaproteobacteria bacterium]
MRLELDGERISHAERMLSDPFGRIRDVQQGLDGLLCLLTDAHPGKLICWLPITEVR